MAHGTLKIDTIKSSAAGLAPIIVDSADREIIQGCTAWVNFIGWGTVTIRDSFNVSSITDNGLGDYTANFAAVMANTDYAVSSQAVRTEAASADNIRGIVGVYARATGSCSVMAGYSHTIGAYDPPAVYIAVHGGL